MTASQHRGMEAASLAHLDWGCVLKTHFSRLRLNFWLLLYIFDKYNVNKNTYAVHNFNFFFFFFKNTEIKIKWTALELFKPSMGNQVGLFGSKTVLFHHCCKTHEVRSINMIHQMFLYESCDQLVTGLVSSLTSTILWSLYFSWPIEAFHTLKSNFCFTLCHDKLFCCGRFRCCDRYPLLWECRREANCVWRTTFFVMRPVACLPCRKVSGC